MMLTFRYGKVTRYDDSGPLPTFGDQVFCRNRNWTLQRFELPEL